MKSSCRLFTMFTLVATLCASGASLAWAQAHSSSSSSTPAAGTGDHSNPANNTESSLDLMKPPVAGEEKAFKAFKSFLAIPESEMPRKLQAGESFLQKFPTSEYRPNVYAVMTVGYFSTNNADKAIAAGEQCLALKPDDIRTMGVLSQALARLSDPGQPDAAARMAKAEQYGNKAIELAPTLKKPDAATPEAFDAYKNDSLSMAHSGLGLVDIRKGNFTGAIQQLEQANRLNNDRDPANYYLLGFANENTGNFAAAAAAFHHCAAIPGSVQDPCKKGEAEAQKQAASKTK